MTKNSSKVSNENKQGMLFWPRFTQNLILGLEFQKSYSRFVINSSKIPREPIFRQNKRI